MRIVDPIIDELGRESETTTNVLSRVPTGKLAWQPHTKSMTLGKLAWHLASLPGFVASCILKDGVDLAAVGGPEPPDNTAAICEAFKQGVVVAKDTLGKLDDAAAMGDWTLSRGGQKLVTFPRIGFARTILLNHSYHHRGQLSVYLRLLDVPVPSIYGPSADENPFA